MAPPSALWNHLTHPIEKSQDSPKGFNDLPAELQNQIYEYKTIYRSTNGERKTFTEKAFQMRYQIHLPLLCASPQVARDLKPVILGSHTLHLMALQSGEGFKEDRWNRINYAHIVSPQIGRSRASLLYCMYMEVPPLKLRPFFEHLKITLEAPMESKHQLRKMLNRPLCASEQAWNVSEIDWLYPIRELKAIGFERVEELEIEIKYRTLDRCGRSICTVPEMEAWVGDCVGKMEVSARRYSVVFKECNDWRL